jgi:hypothetical protein
MKGSDGAGRGPERVVTGSFPGGGIFARISRALPLSTDPCRYFTTADASRKPSPFVSTSSGCRADFRSAQKASSSQGYAAVKSMVPSPFQSSSTNTSGTVPWTVMVASSRSPVRRHFPATGIRSALVG